MTNIQYHICEHRDGPDEFNSKLIRRERFLDSHKAKVYFDLIKKNLLSGEFVVLRSGGNTLQKETKS